MSRFKRDDTARLNYRKSKEGRYGEDGRLATCIEYLGKSMWLVRAQDTGKLRRWYTADMENVTDLVEHKSTVQKIKELVGVGK